MSAAKKPAHTPGPWVIYKPKVYSYVRTEDGRYVMDHGLCLNVADAHLIAAAPDLLAAAQFAVSQLPDFTDTAIVYALVVAIQKAQGIGAREAGHGD